jgi:hypothetical protein
VRNDRCSSAACSYFADTEKGLDIKAQIVALRMGLRDKDRFIQTAHNEWQSSYEEFKSTNQRMLTNLPQLKPINIHR